MIALSTIGGRRIAQLLTRPVVADFLEHVGVVLAWSIRSKKYSFVVVARWTGRTLREAAIRKSYGCTDLTIPAAHGALNSHPDADTQLRAGDVLVIIGSVDELNALRNQFTAACPRARFVGVHTAVLGGANPVVVPEHSHPQGRVRERLLRRSGS